MTLIDISQPVTPRTAAFPGDERFSCGWTASIATGASVNVGWAKTSPHVGTHVDAPYHYDPAGRRVGELPLEAFIGPALVLDARGLDEIGPEALRGLDLTAKPRLLLRTQERTDPDVFTEAFPCFTAEAIDVLVRAKVCAVGVDVPSVDPVDAKDLAIHKALGHAGIVNIENLRLDDVEAGAYELLAAPIAWRDMDAAPLRAVLRR